MAFRPTKRELFLVLFLFVLVSFTGPNSTRNWFLTPISQSQSQSHSNSDTSVDQPQLQWTTGHIPETVLVRHAPGWTIFDNLYLMSGTLYIVTSLPPSSLPDRSHMISTGYPMGNTKEEIAKRRPGDKEMRIVSPLEAERIFGAAASRIDGVTFLMNDPAQFVRHYYHYCAELLWGTWRVYTSLDPSIPPSGHTTLPPPRRLLFPNLPDFRDSPGMNALVTRGAFPSASIEFSPSWDDRAVAMKGVPWIFDRVLLADRGAAANGTNHYPVGRPAAEAFNLITPSTPNYWLPIRNNILDLAKLPRSVASASDDKIVITYISRQNPARKGRMLDPADHERLVDELYKLRDAYGYEVNVVNMEKLEPLEQIRLAGRTTIMMGPHGNGLTHALWMNPHNPRATLMEFVFPGGWSYDYSYTSHKLGLKYFVFHNNEWSPFSETRKNVQPEGFHGPNIPIDGAVVARLCQEIIAGAH